MCGKLATLKIIMTTPCKSPHIMQRPNNGFFNASDIFYPHHAVTNPVKVN